MYLLLSCSACADLLELSLWVERKPWSHHREEVPLLSHMTWVTVAQTQPKAREMSWREEVGPLGASKAPATPPQGPQLRCLAS